jgi:hypothetical protein
MKMITTLVAAAALSLGFVANASAQSAPPAQWPTNQSDAQALVDHLPPATWLAFSMSFHQVDDSALSGKPWIAVYNPYPDTIVSLVCQDGSKSWELAGQKAYNSDSPKSIPGHTRVLVDTKGFDGYCGHDGNLIAFTSTHKRFVMTIDQPGNFTASLAMWPSSLLSN